MPLGAASAALGPQAGASGQSDPTGPDRASAPVRDGFAMLANLARTALEAAAEAMVAAEPTPRATPTAIDPGPDNPEPAAVAPPPAANPVEVSAPAASSSVEPAGPFRFELIDCDGAPFAHPGWSLDRATGRLRQEPTTAARGAGLLRVRVTGADGASWIETIPTAAYTAPAVAAPAPVFSALAAVAPPPAAAKPAPLRIEHALPARSLFGVDGAYRPVEDADFLDIDALGPVAFDMRAHMMVGEDGVPQLYPVRDDPQARESDIVLVDDPALTLSASFAPPIWSLDPGALSQRGRDRVTARSRLNLAWPNLDLRAPIATMPTIAVAPAPVFSASDMGAPQDDFDASEFDDIELDLDFDPNSDGPAGPTLTMDWDRALATGAPR
jgi:hypothetical protein